VKARVWGGGRMPGRLNGRGPGPTVLWSGTTGWCEGLGMACYIGPARPKSTIPIMSGWAQVVLFRVGFRAAQLARPIGPTIVRISHWTGTVRYFDLVRPLLPIMVINTSPRACHAATWCRGSVQVRSGLLWVNEGGGLA